MLFESVADSRVDGLTLPNVCRRSAPLLAVFFLLSIVSLGLAEPIFANQPTSPGQTLWAAAVAAATREDWQTAAINFERLHREFPASELAEEALWRAAELRRKIAEQDPDPDWDQVRALFRLYLSDYPDSLRADAAYLAMGMAYFQMRFLREALTHFRLFERRYPHSPLVPRARHWQALTMVETGALAEAVALFRELTREPDEELRLEAIVELGRTLATSGDHPGAIDTFHGLLRDYPQLRFNNVELLFDLGLSYLRAGREEQGREQLFIFINLLPDSLLRPLALFEIGESRRRQGDLEAAQRLYAQVLEEGDPGQRELVLARFRQVEHLDAIGRPPEDPADPADDRFYLEVIDRFGHDAIAQDARYSLFKRVKLRNDLVGATELATSYLRRSPPQPAAEPGLTRAGELMVFLVRELLARGEYQRIYHLYVNEYHHVVAYEPGRLRLLIGQAFEALGLYLQAAEIYLRALAGSLDRDELIELYYRRAEVYFVLRDLVAAERLLSHLRLVYVNKPELVEIYYLIGRLREEEQRYDEALEFFRQALAKPAAASRRDKHGRGYLRALAAVNEYGEMLSVLVRFQREQGLSFKDLQAWYRRAGDGLRRHGLVESAITAYRAAVAVEMPVAGKDYQVANFHLGVLLADQGETAEAGKRLELARIGPDQLLAAMAVKELNQLIIAKEMTRMRSLFE